MYTPKDLAQIERDIEKFQKGERVSIVGYGDHRVHYADVTLDALLKLRQRMRAELQSYAKRRLIFMTSKGVD